MPSKTKRNQRGQFQKGTASPNPHGRPKKLAPANIPEAYRAELFEIACAPIVVTENGKRRQVTIRQAIMQRLVQLALSGDRQALILWARTIDKHLMPEGRDQMEAWEQLMTAEERARNCPDDVTDEELEMTRSLREQLNPKPRKKRGPFS